MSGVSVVDVLLGPSLAGRIVIVATVLVYLYLFLRRPDDAKASLRNGLETFGRLFTLIVAALLLASAIGVLVPPSAIEGSIGEAAGPQGVVLAGLLGGILPGGPYATYPIVKGVQASGAGFAAVIAMVTGYAGIGVARIPYGLVFFDSKTVAIRVVVGVLATVAIALGVFLVV